VAIKETILCQGPYVTASSDWDHVVAVIGWDDDSATCRTHYGRDKCWIIKNSHGVFTNWSQGPDGTDIWHTRGYAYIPINGHEYSTAMRLYGRYVGGVTPP
jgi:C1A family cysteine protease